MSQCVYVSIIVSFERSEKGDFDLKHCAYNQEIGAKKAKKRQADGAPHMGYYAWSLDYSLYNPGLDIAFYFFSNDHTQGNRIS